MTEHLDRNQTGFVVGIQKNLNLLMLTEKLRKMKKRESECCFFTDHKSAYNSVNRKRLYSIMKRKRILAEDEFGFLERLHDALYFKYGEKRFYFKNGVH
jgi:hypothetical protein